jgi:hypothetical protein
MSRNLVLPFFPVPPNEYQQQYFAEVVRAISVYMQNERNPGEGRHTAMVLTNLQSNDQGLETGALFEQDGFVKIAKANTPHVGGLTATGAVGSVTVSTT